jgi:hypothetical protein
MCGRREVAWTAMRALTLLSRVIMFSGCQVIRFSGVLGRGAWRGAAGGISDLIFQISNRGFALTPGEREGREIRIRITIKCRSVDPRLGRG